MNTHPSLSSTSGAGSMLGLLITVSFLNQAVTADFWRYTIALQSSSRDVGACPLPTPAVQIRSGESVLRLFEETPNLTCVVPAEGFGLDCTGRGSVTFDVPEPLEPTATRLNVAMDPPSQELNNGLGCVAGLPVAQAYSVAQVCPDGSVDPFRLAAINCSPATAFRAGTNANFCQSSCFKQAFGTCLAEDFPTVTSSLINTGCVFPEAVVTVAPTQVPVTAPTTAPVITAPTANPVTDAPTSSCALYDQACVFASDCCSNRCVTQLCQKAIPEGKTKLADGRGGAAGAAKDSGVRRTLTRSIRGAEGAR